MKYITGFVVGFAGSKILYNATHQNHFPETGRYAIGILLIALSMWLSGETDNNVEEFLLFAFPVGAGVAIARIF